MTVRFVRHVTATPLHFAFALAALLALDAGGALAAPKGGAPPEPGAPSAEECALLDDPKLTARMDGLLYYLAKGCGREAEFLGGVTSGEGFAGESDSSPTAVDIAVSNPAQDTSGTAKTQSETSIAFNPTTGTLCAAWNDSFHGVTQSVGFSGFGRSTDGGATWTDAGAVSPTSDFDTGDPSLVWRKSDGKFYYAALKGGGLGLYRSDDDCQSFTFLSQIASGSDDKEIMAVDNNAASAYYGRLYVVWTDFGAGARIFETHSDNGTSWSTQVALSAAGVDVQGAWPAVAPNGNVYATWVRWNPYSTGPIDTEVARSTDGGGTWALVTNPMTGKTNPRDSAASSSCGRPALGGNIRYLPSPTIAVDSNNHLHVVYSYDPDAFNSGDESNVYYRKSTDNGATWGTEIQINDDGGTTDQWQPSLSIGTGNVVTVGYYSRQNDAGGNLMFDYYSRTSFDGGATFQPSVRMTDASSSVVLDPNLATCYHGDYDTQSHSVGFAHYLWSDDRGGTPDVKTEATPAGTDFLVVSQQASRRICAPADATYTIDVLKFLTFSEVVTLNATGNPAGTSVGFSSNAQVPPFTSTLTIGNTGAATAGTSTITVEGVASSNTHSTPVGLTIDTAAPAAPTLTAPANGATNVNKRPTFTWSAVANAASYLLQVDDDAGFGSLVYSQTVSGTSHQPPTDLPTNTVLYWRVRPTNTCGDGGFSGVFSFTTEALPGDCSIGSAAYVPIAFGFESGASGWTSSGTGNTWAQSSARAHAGNFSWFAADPATISDQRLVSPAVPVPSGSGLTLQFWNFRNIENNGATACYDGGILEISTDNVVFTQLTTFVSDPYTGIVSSSFSNPLAGLNAWCGAPGTWQRAVTSLDAYAGQTVYFRLRLGSDSSVSREGWYIDDVAIQSCITDGIFNDGLETGDYLRWSENSTP